LAGFLLRKACTSDRLTLAMHQGLLSLPVLGRTATALASLQMTETLAVLLQAGVPALTALETAGQAVNNRYYSCIIAEICENMRAGRSIAASLASYRQFDEMFVRMIAAGEESGSLSEMLMALSRHLQKDLLHKLDSMIALLEPALILVVAFLVGTTVVATLLPMYSLMNVTAGI
jgi:type II secretory pathway component PulF